MTPAELVAWGGTDLALTLWPEWAWAIVYLDKDVENRGFDLLRKDRRLREAKGRLIIHAGKTIGGGKMSIGEARQSVISMATRAGWQYERTTGYFRKGPRRIRGLLSDIEQVASKLITTTTISIISEPHANNIDRWRVPSQYGHIFADIRLLPHPIPCKGAQGLWSVSAALTKAA